MTFAQLELFERWLPVVGYEGLYEVSDWGRVRRVAAVPKRHYGKLLNLSKFRNGYFYVDLAAENRRSRFSVHRLVMAAFAGPCPLAKEVHHLDGDKSHNSVLNLAYVTKSENQKAEFESGRKSHAGEKCPAAKLTREKVIEIKRLHQEGMTQRAIARHFGLQQPAVSNIIRGKSWKSLFK